MKKNLLAVPILLAISSASFAAETDNAFSPHFYGGAKLGSAMYSDLGSGVTSVTDVDDTAFAWGAFVGMQTLPWLALELGYHNLGEIDLKDVSGSYDAQVINLTAKVSYDIVDRVSVFGKAGTQWFDWNANGSGVYESETGWTPHFGLGVEYQFNKTHKNWTAALEYTWYNDIGGPDVNYIGVSTAYHWR